MTNPFVTYNNLLYPGEYIAPLNPYTNYGYVINPFYFVTTFGRYFSIYSGVLTEVAQNCQTTGYLEVRLSTSQGMKHIMTHRGVMATFNPVPNMYDLQVDHIDSNHFNNNLYNLRWVTCRENNIYARQTGTTSPRSRAISDDDIIAIMELAKQGLSDEEICERLPDLKIATQTVRIIRTGKAIYGEILDRLGIEPIVKRSHKSLSNVDYDKIKEIASLDLKSETISKIMGISARTIRGVLQRERDGYDRPPKEKNPFVQVPDKYSDLNIHMVNIYSSPKHVIQPFYGVSRDGRMFSMARGSWVEMTIAESKSGYSVLGLLTDHGNKQFFVHRLVLATFCPVPDMYNLEVNHKNGIHNDNRLENLEWVTPKQNMKHAAKVIIVRPMQRACDEDIIKIISLAKEGKTDEEISALMNGKYTSHNVRIIRSGLKTYGPVLKQLNLEPVKYHGAPISPETKQSIYTYIESRLGTKGTMDLYIECGTEFGIPSESVRRIYGDERAKRRM